MLIWISRPEMAPNRIQKAAISRKRCEWETIASGWHRPQPGVDLERRIAPRAQPIGLALGAAPLAPSRFHLRPGHAPDGPGSALHTATPTDQILDRVLGDQLVDVVAIRLRQSGVANQQ